ncbi:hypothetical protein RSOLAG1IB_01568 [Rhizoctonia solani AG-1 IB]|uniref:Uncharacterized protein n=1 Tax=Thanatephorus cucumeris (strain AG1-IB / isolate 7/3/14) TaxID=1108050 RepID=A0A0B7FC16_THACB|nr:hypothetical protein RSOLAG1IB_01568 [Rhizoctonia solani AG-1 IB]
MSGSVGRWVIWHSRQPHQQASDALANWSAKANASVEWIQHQHRNPDNTVVHTVVPVLTCTKAHALMDGCGRVLEFPNGDFGQVERAVDDWRRRQQNHQLLGHSYHVGGYPQPYVSVMIHYRLIQCRIDDCSGVGPSVKVAKAEAAERLLRSGHCMLRLD